MYVLSINGACVVTLSFNNFRAYVESVVDGYEDERDYTAEDIAQGYFRNTVLIRSKDNTVVQPEDLVMDSNNRYQDSKEN